MSKPDKQRVGLQRKVSSVFKGMTIPGEKRVGKSSPEPEEDNGVTSRNAMPDNNLTPKILQCNDSDSSSISPKPAVPQIRKSEKPVTDSIEKKTDAVDPKARAESKQPVSRAPHSTQSSLMKKLAQSEEREDTAVCRPSVLEEPEVEKASATTGKTDSDKAGESAGKTSHKQQPPQESLMKKLAQLEELSSKTISESKADVSHLITPKRETSLNHKLKRDRNPEVSPASTVQKKHPLADQLANAVDEGGFLQQIKDKLIPSQEEGGSAKDKIMVMLIPILAIVMIFAFRHVLQKSPSKASATDKKEEKVVAAAKSDGEIEWKIPDPLPVMTRDPLKLPQNNDKKNPDEAVDRKKPEPESSTLAAKIRNGVVNIRAIVYSEDKASALIGNRIVCNGCKINDVTVVKINPTSVVFESNGETWVQKVHN